MGRLTNPRTLHGNHKGNATINQGLHKSPMDFNRIAIDEDTAFIVHSRMEKSSARWWDLPSAIFISSILFSAWRLQSTGWTDGLEHVRNVKLLGLIIAGAGAK